jgi:diaminopimelate decarboxylase
MAKVRLVSPRPLGRANLPLVDSVVAAMRPTDPLLCLRPAAIAGAARRFVDRFPGDVLYAVKCNPEPRVLRALWAGGVRQFDCASLAEVGLVASSCGPPSFTSCTRSRADRRSARPFTAMG